jgi:hypothetical protein
MLVLSTRYTLPHSTSTEMTTTEIPRISGSHPMARMLARLITGSG